MKQRQQRGRGTGPDRRRYGGTPVLVDRSREEVALQRRWDRVDVAESLRVAERVQAARKDCCRNALLALLVVDELEDACYVEGIGVSFGTMVPLEHAWIERQDGSVVEPTWVLPYGITGRLEPDPQVRARGRYYAGRRWTRQEAQRLLGRTLPITFGGDVGVHAAHYWSLRDGMTTVGPDGEEQPIRPATDLMLRRMFGLAPVDDELDGSADTDREVREEGR